MSNRSTHHADSRASALTRVSSVLVTTLMLVIMAAQPVAAHQVEQTNTWYSSNGFTCQHVTSRMGHGNGNGYVYTKGQAVKHGYGFDCWLSLNLSAGKVFAKWRLFKWTGNTWAFCNQGGGVYNASGDNEAISWWDLPNSNYFCGTGAYSNIGDSWHDAGNGQVGGSLSSGAHQLPA